MQASSTAELNTLRSRRSWSTLSSSTKTLRKAQGTEIITSHMATAALQTQSARSAGLPRPLHRAQASSSGPRRCCSPGPAHPITWGGRGPCPGRQEGAEAVFPMGQGGAWWQGSGLATFGCCGPG